MFQRNTNGPSGPSSLLNQNAVGLYNILPGSGGRRNGPNGGMQQGPPSTLARANIAPQQTARSTPLNSGRQSMPAAQAKPNSSYIPSNNSSRPLFSQPTVGSYNPLSSSSNGTMSHQFERLGLDTSGQMRKTPPKSGMIGRPRTSSSAQYMQGYSQTRPSSLSTSSPPSQKSRRVVNNKRPATTRNRSNTEPCMNASRSKEEQLKAQRKIRKNDREKQRRFELNDKFKCLNQLLSLGRKAKVEKITILTEAINTIKTLRAEVHEMRNERNMLRKRIETFTDFMARSNPEDAKKFFSIHGQGPDSSKTHNGRSSHSPRYDAHRSRNVHTTNTTLTTNSMPQQINITRSNNVSLNIVDSSGSYGSNTSSSSAAVSSGTRRHQRSPMVPKRETARRSSNTTAAGSQMVIDSAPTMRQTTDITLKIEKVESPSSSPCDSMDSHNSSMSNSSIGEEDSMSPTIEPDDEIALPPFQIENIQRSMNDYGVPDLEEPDIIKKEKMDSSFSGSTTFSDSVFSHYHSPKREDSHKEFKLVNDNFVFASSSSGTSGSSMGSSSQQVSPSQNGSASFDGGHNIRPQQTASALVPSYSTTRTLGTAVHFDEQELNEDDCSTSETDDIDEADMIDEDGEMLNVLEDKLQVTSQLGGQHVNLFQQVPQRSMSPFAIKNSDPFARQGQDEWLGEYENFEFGD